jgi:hypothetical protein
MRMAKFVRSVDMVDIDVAEGQEDYKYYAHSGFCKPLSPTEAIISDFPIEEPVCRIHDFHRRKDGEPDYDIYIAYSKEVQEHLKLPFDMLAENCERAYQAAARAEMQKRISQNVINSYNAMGYWQRLWFALTDKHI